MTQPSSAQPAEEPIILASASPRRSQLLGEGGIPFHRFFVEVDEEGLSEAYRGPLLMLGEYLAGEKALATWRALVEHADAGRRVLASDTTVLLEGRSLAKPKDAAAAAAMLRELRGREHTVATGLALVDPARGALLSTTSATRVRMRDYSDAEIAAYVATGDPLDKAGSYSIQHPDFQPVEWLTGCHLGVIGLPVCLVWPLLGDARRMRVVTAPLPSDAPDCPWSARCTPPFPFLKPGIRRRLLPGVAGAADSPDVSEAGG
ncbi:MAG TPA: Maf family protein [Ktedonobacterales bacterium]|nr:Maf family protein [Ktedonobacterales bacterium]